MKPSQYYQTGLTLALSSLIIPQVAANADKIIFTGPEPNTIPLAKPSLSDLNLDVLGRGSAWDIRTNLTRTFPVYREFETEDGETDFAKVGKDGYSSWFLLDNLVQGRRYELRVCWAAIEPTRFALDVYNLDTVWEAPDLITSLAEYSASRQQHEQEESKRAPSVHIPPDDNEAGERTSSVLLLHVHAAADYFTTNKELMESPPPVLVDLILDPYLYNAVPHSLLLTVFYLVMVSIASFFVASHVVKLYSAIGLSDTTAAKKLR